MASARPGSGKQLGQTRDVAFDPTTLFEVQFAESLPVKLRRPPVAGNESYDIGHGVERCEVAMLDGRVEQVGNATQLVARDAQFRRVVVSIE